MKESERNTTRIPKEELTAFERWELPLLDARGNEVPRDEERNVKPLTAADIEAIRKEAYEDGKAEGREAGHKEGFDKGFEEGRRAGHEEGFAKGQEEGRETGLQEYREQIDQRLEKLDELLGELLGPIDRHHEEVEAALVNLTTALARSVVFRELNTDSSHIAAVVRRALETLPSTAENVRIHIHPDDSEWVKEVAGRYDGEASVVDDESLMRGGCKLETRHSLVDFTVEKRFQKAVQGMLDQELAGATSDADSIEKSMDDLTDFHRDVLDETEASPPDDEADQSHDDRSGDAP